MFVILNEEHVYGPYQTFEQAQGVVASYLFGNVIIEKPNEYVNGIMITQMSFVCP